MQYNVIEIFLSIDGEGVRTGEPTIFLRLAGCNLHCSYCDTDYSWDIKNSDCLDKSEVINKINALSDGWVKNITITGGEPLINTNIDVLILELCNLGYNVNIETNGSINPRVHHPNLFYTVDYKCPYSNMNDKMNMDIYNNLTKEDIVKFVVADENDLLATLKIVKQYPWLTYYYSPVFSKIEPVQIVQFILTNRLTNVKIQLQLHKLIWDPQMRGV